MTDNGRVEAGDYWRGDSGNINLFGSKGVVVCLRCFQVKDSKFPR